MWRKGPIKWHWSNQDGIKYIKPSGVTHQPKWLSVSHGTLVQEGNYLSQSRHSWRGDTPKISAHRTGEYYAKRNEPGGERQIPYDLTDKWNLSTKQTSKQNRTRDSGIKNKLTVTRREGQITGERRERVKSRTMYKGPIEKAS